MSARISYMGTKHDLAHHVADVIAGCRSGRLLDAFAGMGAVAEAHACQRQIWTNDVQHFAHLAATCRFTDIKGPPKSADLRRLVMPLYTANLRCLRDQNGAAWRAAVKLSKADTFEEFERAYQRIAAARIEHEGAYGCFISLYANAYFSLIQCADIDSIRCALDTLKGRGSLTSAEFDWALFALGHATLRVANTTGHFAQYLTPSVSNFMRVTKQFRRSVFKEWLASLSALKPIGSSEWRAQNTATRSDCKVALRSANRANDVGTVYCDPPYTDDQYSRFYHVWETLVLYDYPDVSGQGLYRPGRFTTDFSLRSKVSIAFRELIADVAATGADIVLSYPSNGLLHEIGLCPLELLRETFPNAQLAKEIKHKHSTMGASKGPAKAVVAERIYIGKAA